MIEAIIWLVIMIVLIVFELITLGLTTIWFAAGALVALITALFGAVWWQQCIVFIVVSFIMLFFTRPFAVKYINRNTTKTNVDSMEGKTGKVTTAIDNDQAEGYIMVDGQLWAARSEDGSVIPKDAMVRVVSIEGVKAIVREI